MSVIDRFWTEDPMPVGKIGVQGRCEQCWREAYGSWPGHVFCREHMLEHQNKAIAEIVARCQVVASVWAPVAVLWAYGLWS